MDNGTKFNHKENIRREALMRIGDRIVMSADPESRGYGQFANIPDGTQGTVVGFRNANFYVGRIGDFGRPPGLHFANGGAIVRWDNGITGSAGNAFQFADNNLERQAERAKDVDYIAAFEMKNVVLEPLPELPFYEWDICSFTGSDFQRHWPRDRRVKIKRIEYRDHDKLRSMGDAQMPIYAITPITPGYGTMYARADQLRLERRGNVFLWYNDLRDQMTFNSFEDELSFYMTLGQISEEYCTEQNGYTWTRTLARAALVNGLFDFISDDTTLVGTLYHMRGLKFDDREFGARARAHALRCFNH